MPDQKIRGVIVPILTPLNSDETVDTQSLRRLVNYLIDNGVHGIWASGTTGEFASLSNQQRLISMETVVDEVAGRVAVIGNVSGSSTQLSLQLALEVQEMGLDGVAVTPPYYYPHAQDELLDHYRYISDRSGLPLLQPSDGENGGGSGNHRHPGRRGRGGRREGQLRRWRAAGGA